MMIALKLIVVALLINWAGKARLSVRNSFCNLKLVQISSIFATQ